VSIAVRSEASHGEGEALKPYVPRLQIEWLRETPDLVHQTVDGSLAFVDISGFTALTERLARRGKIGAELLRDILDGVLISLLDEAYVWGAGLVKWGGDALLLLFDGPEHPERAVRAAWEMQRTIDRVGRIRTGGTTSMLRMSIGISSGPLEFFLAGSVHRELAVVGPVATEAVSMEAIADAGEVALSPVLAGLLDPACVGARKEGAFLLRAAPAVAAWRAPDVGAVDGIDIAGAIPLALREHVLLERSEPEHRVVTAAFVDFMHTDELLAALGPAAFAEALDERMSSVQEIAARYAVPFNAADVSKNSIKVLLTAGAPSSTGHDEEQMLRVARELVDATGRIPIRIGIETGRIFTGDFGPPYRRTYATLGDAINTAARIMSRAAAGEVLATEAVLSRSRSTFETTPIEPFQAKGKAEPVRASLIGPVTGRRRQSDADASFCGRGRELGALDGVLRDVIDGRGWTVEIAGGAGLGKSRLIHEALSARPEVRVLRAACEEYEASTPYYALRAPVRMLLGLDESSPASAAEQRLRDAVASIDDGLLPWVPLLGILLGLDLPPTPETSRLDERFLAATLADVTLRFLAASLDGAPAVLVVEDAHFLDEASADLLRRLSQAAGSLPYATVLVRSDPEASSLRLDDESTRCVAFALVPLPLSEAQAMVERATDDKPLHPHEVEELARRSGGSPLFLLELLAVMRATGTADALPDSVEALLTADIDRLPPSDRVVLRMASVLGATFERELLATALHGDVTVDDSVWARLRGLVDPASSGRMQFRSSLLREAAYEGLSFRRRRELHARVAETIEATASSLDDEAATLALHYSAARRHEQTWRFARLAGDRAQAVAANLEAARLYELALSAAGFVRSASRRERADVLVALGTAREMAGLFDQSFDALRQASRLLAGDHVEQARIFARRTRARVRRGAYPLALRETAAGLRLVDGRDDIDAVAARATLRAMRSEICMFQGRARESIRIAEIAIAEAERADALEALAHAYTALDGSYQMLGEPEKAVHERKALEIYTRLGNDRLSGIYGLNVGVQAYADGRWDEAVELYTNAREACLRAGDRQNAAHAATNLGELLVSRGRLDEAEGLLVEARRTLRSSGYAAFALFAEIQLARCALARGEAAVALDTLEQIAREALGVGYAALVLEAGVYLGHAHAHAGSPEAGLEALDAAVAAGREDTALYAAAIERARAACLAALGRRDEARACLDRALEEAERQGLLYEQLEARRARAELEGASAEELRETARLAQLLGIDAG
jgi:predicted ATPase/class 3 adenylate cyclase